MAYKCANNLAPEYLCAKFKIWSSIRGRVVESRRPTQALFPYLKVFNPLTSVPAVTGRAKTHPQFPVPQPAVKNHVRIIAFPTLPEEILVLLLFYCC